MVRNASYSQNKTYQTSLCLMYLDRFGDPSDVVRIQMLAVRLLVGQTAQGGWTYEACPSVSGAHEQVLRTLKSDHTPGKLHPDIEKYGQTLARGGQNPGFGGDDNSNTQFAIIAVWIGVSWVLPRAPGTTWRSLLPGAVLFGVGVEILQFLTIYFFSRYIANKTDTYGTIGASIAILLWAYLGGRLIVPGAFLNAARWRQSEDQANVASASPA
jgi:hypothetical protein